MLYPNLKNRVKASILDFLIVLIPVYAFVVQKYFFIAFCFTILYYSIFESSKLQGSIGKKVFRLKVTDKYRNKISLKRALIRNFYKFFISIIVIFLGFIISGFTKKNQTYHDIISGTFVVNKNTIKDNDEVIENTDNHFKLINLNFLIISTILIIGFLVINYTYETNVEVFIEMKMVIIITFFIISSIGFYNKNKWSLWGITYLLTSLVVNDYHIVMKNLTNYLSYFNVLVLSFFIILITSILLLFSEEILVKFKFKHFSIKLIKTFILISIFVTVIIN
ncbi:MAG: RDD family protein [Clostridiales bacterium]